MVKKLLSLFPKKIELKLLRNAVFVTLPFVLGAFLEFRWWIVLLALIITFVFYRSLPERRLIRVSFLCAVVLAWWSALFVTHDAVRAITAWWGAPLWSLLIALLFFVLGRIGIGTVPVPSGTYSFLHTALISVVAFVGYLVAWNGSPASLVLGAVALSVVEIFLMREVFQNYGFSRMRTLVASVALGVIALELFVVLGLLPLGAWNAAAFIALSLFLLRDSIIAHTSGVLRPALLLRSLTVFVALSVLIFAAASWSI